jgi:hypothetical protein
MKVNHLKYRLFDYSDYIDNRCNPIQRPSKLTYDLGDVVFIKEEKAIGVVIGVIDEIGAELRTDMSGMVCYSQIRKARKSDLKRKNIRIHPDLLAELRNL